MAFYCHNHFALIGFLSSNTVFAAGSEAAHAVIVTAVSPCEPDFKDILVFPCFLQWNCSRLPSLRSETDLLNFKQKSFHLEMSVSLQ